MFHNCIVNRSEVPPVENWATAALTDTSRQKSPSVPRACLHRIQNKPNFMNDSLGFSVFDRRVLVKLRRCSTHLLEVGQQHSGQVFALRMPEQHRMVRTGTE